MIYIASILIIISEVFLDLFIWKKIKEKKVPKWIKSDKLVSTTYRAVMIASLCIIFWPTWQAAALMIAMYGLFDQAINIAMWNNLPRPYNYRRQHGMYETKWQKIVYEKNVVWTRLFYHGENKSWKNFSDWYDLIWQRIPQGGEILIKGIAIGVASYYYWI